MALIVSDLDAAIEFYVNKLGLKILHRVDRPQKQSTILYLDAGNAIVELFSYFSPPKRVTKHEACGLRHLAFSVDNFDEMVKKLNGMGIETEPPQTDARSGKRITFFRDPDYLPLEICEI